MMMSKEEDIAEENDETDAKKEEDMRQGNEEDMTQNRTSGHDDDHMGYILD